MTQKNVKVSLVLPSLNVISYIEECLESVIHQTLKEIEIICVDAGSVDGTLEILREYERRDNRIKVIVSDKKSYGYQMNLGMSVAQGEYIGIVETDDYVPREMYEELYHIAAENNVDFVKADFYRFTREKGEVHKGYYKLTSDTRYYNCVLYPLETPLCFTFLMNTWSGIYKRSFLKTNNILHNETPGASYQDNGFWFQTFMYAKRAWFVNKAYYRNRRDNPNSSVYDQGKAFCICDEYAFLWDIISQKPNLLEKVKYIYAFACHQAYKSNLSRIKDDDKPEFLERYSVKFKKLRKYNALDRTMYSPEDWEMLLSIMEDANTYYQREIQGMKRLNATIRQYEKVIIYGAGMIGKKLYHELTYNKNPVNIICFAVSRVEDNVGSYMDVPIRDIRELSAFRDDSLVVVAVTQLYQEEMVANARKLGFLHILAISEKRERTDVDLLKRGKTSEALTVWYQHKTGEKLNLLNPVTWNQKQQWLKIHGNSQLFQVFSDRLRMRSWLEARVGRERLTPLFGVYQSADDIPFAILPNQFIIQCTHGLMWRVIVEDKNNTRLLHEDIIKRRLNKWLHLNYAYSDELDFYSVNVTPQLMVEGAVENQLLPDEHIVLCFEGEPRYLVSDTNRKIWGARNRDLFDIEGNHIDANMGYQNANRFSAVHVADMIRLACVIAEGVPFMAVHFYDTEDGVLIRQALLTFEGGICPICPGEVNKKMGEFIRAETE